ncbi:hypothetical protein KDK95_26475 [Actinospica sp. MGRD01-02]|uniref:Uncharacterized protein n=1 Tax=Actinospica acidithermotolerans TaxID=2828514 RepID=A0A941ELQ5_9ACTN|nr:hypothetical protein [Actinospica acidithermotolerans]MBR7829879.1 hypothetical protein [Actinospica acidithermotolerans]
MEQDSAKYDHPLDRRMLFRAAGLGAGALLIPIGLAAGTAAASMAASAQNSGPIVVAAGETVTIGSTTRTNLLSIASGGTLAAPSGYILTVTVNGVETGSQLVSTYGLTTVIAPGTYRGDVVIEVALENPQTFFGAFTFQLRQAVYVDSTGINSSYSALSAVTAGKLGATSAHDLVLRSTGEAFDGFYVADGTYELLRPDIRFEGNGRCDFVGYGASLVGDGTSTRFVIDGARIDNTGAVRPGVIATNGANVIVKNSVIATHDGVLPSDYTASVGPNMMTVPWMLGLSGNVRATIALGVDTKATYVNSQISSTNWGVLSTDSDNEAQLTAINCDLTITDKEGYGTYADGSAIDRFLGCRFHHVAYAAISTGGSVYFGDSTRAAVAALNTSQDIRLTAAELASIPVENTVIDSTRFGVMWAQGGGGSVTIDGGTQLRTAETSFLVKAVKVTVTVDGSDGAQVTPGNGVLLQMMETDDPGSATGTYTEPTTTVTKDSTFDVTTEQSADVVATFTDIKLRGDFYNGRRNNQNLVLTLIGSRLDGIVSASATAHAISSISASEYYQLGRVTNTAQAAVNNGVIVTVGSGSVWNVTGTSYLTSLTVDSGGSVRGSLTVDGTATEIVAGTAYTGALVLTAA